MKIWEPGDEYGGVRYSVEPGDEIDGMCYTNEPGDENDISPFSVEPGYDYKQGLERLKAKRMSKPTGCPFCEAGIPIRIQK